MEYRPATGFSSLAVMRGHRLSDGNSLWPHGSYYSLAKHGFPTFRFWPIRENCSSCDLLHCEITFPLFPLTEPEFLPINCRDLAVEPARRLPLVNYSPAVLPLSDREKDRKTLCTVSLSFYTPQSQSSTPLISSAKLSLDLGNAAMVHDACDIALLFSLFS